MRLLVTIVLLLSVAACKTTHPGSSPSSAPITLFTVEGDPVGTEEFMYVYKKNNINNDSAYTEADIREYLDLYVKFKLKIEEAKSLGMDTSAAFKEEFATYAQQLKKPYLTESRVTEQLVQEAYDRSLYEVNASHILIETSQSEGADTLAAYEKALEIRKKLVGGEDFGKMAFHYSNDPSAKNNRGNLGYFTAFQMVYPFESAAYNTPVGEVSMPVRTRYGYHLIKVKDKRPTRGSVQVAHIMIKIRPDKEDSLAARNKIFEIHEQAIGGVPWEELVKQFSEDVNSKNTGGKLRSFTVGQLPYSFQEAAFELEPGEISDPVMTQYGWHIIKLEKVIAPPSFKEQEASIRARIDRDSRAQLNKQMLIKRLKAENGFEVTADAEELLPVYADSTLSSGGWTKPVSYDNVSLFIVGDSTYYLADFFEYIIAEQKSNSYAPQEYLHLLYDKYLEKQIITYEEDHLMDKYVDYRMLVKEYREGILLFQLMEEKVWSKAVQDTVALRQYFEQNRDVYQWKRRARATIYNSARQEVIEEIKGLLASGDSLSLSEKKLERKYNEQTALTLQLDSDTFEYGSNEALDQTEWTPGQYEVPMNGRYNLIIIEQVMPPAPKLLNEVKGVVISDYQNHLEKVWVEQLKQKYSVEINERSLKYVLETLSDQ